MNITMNWDTLAASAGTKQGRKGSKFRSRLTGRTADGNKQVCTIRRKFSEPCKLEKGPEFEVKESKGVFHYQPRVGGKFGKKMVISKSLAEKLMGE